MSVCCPKCRTDIRYAGRLSGEVVSCPVCQKEFRVPFPKQDLSFGKLLPLAVCCLFFGWIVPFFFSSSEIIVDSGSRWTVLWFGTFVLSFSTLGAFFFLFPFSLDEVRSKIGKRPGWIAVMIVAVVFGVVVWGWVDMLLHSAFGMVVEWLSKLNGVGLNRWLFVFKTISSSTSRVQAHMEGLDGVLPDDAGFGLIGAYAFGIGLPEEFIKSLPLFFVVFMRWTMSFRTFLLVGFVSGLAFGVGEALTCYNLVPEPSPLSWWERWDSGVIDTYNQQQAAFLAMNAFQGQLLRWFSSVPMHAVYTAVDAAFIWIICPCFIRDWNKGGDPVSKSIAFCVFSLAAMALVHGMYDLFTWAGLLFDSFTFVVFWLVARWARSIRSELGAASDDLPDNRPAPWKRAMKFSFVEAVVFSVVIVSFLLLFCKSANS